MAMRMSALGMVRVVLTDPDSNVVHLSVACPNHARSIVERAGRNHRFQLSPIGETGRPCDSCLAAHAADSVADWPIGDA